MSEDTLTLKGLEVYELVDASATRMKEPHRRYGNYAKNISIVVKRIVNPPKGQWQGWWTIATRCFGLAYTGGWDEDILVPFAKSLARKMGLDEAKAEELAKYIKQNMAAIIGETAREEAVAPLTFL